MARITLVGLPYSPWTQRARWALDHHGIAHAFQVYMPVVGEPMLRLRTRKLTGRVSVPVSFTPHGAVADSLAIAKHADGVGRGSKLVDGHEAAVSRWVAIAEAALDAARGMAIRAIAASPRAQEEAVSLPLPSALKRGAALFGTTMLARKWNARLPDHEAEARLAEALEQLRSALAENKDGYLDGSFSFADIAMASVLQTVQPVSDWFIRLGPGTREAWTRPTLATRFGDLLAWRDALFERHRPVKTR